MPQFLILGLDGAGKTTLLYRLKLGTDWKNIRKDMKEMREPKSEKDGGTEDPGYHYEEISCQRLFTCGMWDVPGTEPMRRVWRCFYHSIKIHGVIFVVNHSETEPERIELARKHIHVLMNEDELRMAPFAVILNHQQNPDEVIKDGTSTKAKVQGNVKEEELYYRLDLHNVHATCSWRLKVFKINVLALSGENDKAFLDVMHHMKTCLSDSRSYKMML